MSERRVRAGTINNETFTFERDEPINQATVAAVTALDDYLLASRPIPVGPLNSADFQRAFGNFNMRDTVRTAVNYIHSTPLPTETREEKIETTTDTDKIILVEKLIRTRKLTLEEGLILLKEKTITITRTLPPYQTNPSPFDWNQPYIGTPTTPYIYTTAGSNPQQYIAGVDPNR